MIQTLSVPERPSAPPYAAAWRTAGSDLLDAWRTADAERLAPALDRVACLRRRCGDEDDRLELMEGIGEEMLRVLLRRRREPASPVAGTDVWDRLLSHLLFVPPRAPDRGM